VPAAAVIRGGRALFIRTWRKAFLGGSTCVNNKKSERDFEIFVKTVFLEILIGLVVFLQEG